MVRSSAKALLLLVLLGLAPAAAAWNAAGHRISATIAWENLDQNSRRAVTAILRQHPDFDRWQARSKSDDPGRTAFVEASTWPDDIRRDRRFYSAGSEEPTPTLAGFPDMERRLDWHYVDRPLGRLAGTKTPTGEIERQIGRLARTVGNPKARPDERAYALPWLIHLVGDAHQPLHAASRYAADGTSDQGGNAVNIVNPFNSRYPATTLHRYWDDLPGPPWLRDSRLAAAVGSLMSRHPAPATGTTAAQWIDESWHLARDHAYPPDWDDVPTIDAIFHQNALAIANRRVTEAGYRLAALLRSLLASDGGP
ncbi:MAG TPA: S1/P1 nuclease [Candidatus Accumulibacter phosphatis]|nr:MAG: S1/P1 Nuclease [Candidatus Accumulibacter sp. SK-11]HRL75063.1 S1/P1 nuclease [Candidatus Accumulibacter phosphatis]HRQ93834.1 S1/P1 nuclease [Candidatus Accumulibacter phosphatis]